MSEKNDKSIKELEKLQEKKIKEITGEKTAELKDGDLEKVSGGIRGDHQA